MLEKFAKLITRVLLAIAATVLALMMFLTATDVLLRYIFNRPLSGAFELVEYMMALVVPFSIVYCAEQKSHVAVDLIMDHMPKNFQRVVGILMLFATIAFAILITWENILYVRETYATKLTSAVLLIPTYPFVAPVAIGIGAFAVVLCVQLLQCFSEEETQK
jgi:TRAP-type C4-dicarboxylate transport system permease small subunit